MSTQAQIRWQFIQTQPTKEVIAAWHKLCQDSKLISASSTPTFALNANKLVNATVFYGLAYKADRLVSALPLVIKSTKCNGFSFRYLQVATHDHLDYFVAAGQSELSETQLIESLIEACRKQLTGWHLFFSRRWFFESKINRSYISQSYTRQAAYFDLREKQSIAEVISKKLLKNLNRFEKKLLVSNEQLKLVQMTGKSSVQDSLQVFYGIEKAGWKGKAGSAISQTNSLSTFYNQCWQEFAENKNAKLFELKQEDRTIAACIAFQHTDNLFLHKITYDEALSKMSPGSILVKKIIESCIEQGNVSKLCFNTNPPWVRRWHPEIDQLLAIQAFNANIKGFVLNRVIKLYNLLRRIKRRLEKRD